MDGLQSQQVRTLIRWLKEGPSGAIPFSLDSESPGSLHAAAWEDAGNAEMTDHLLVWHRCILSAFALPLPMTAVSIRRWLTEQILEAPERLLFWVRDGDGRAVGHVGLTRFDFVRETVAVHDVVCGVRGAEVILMEGVETLKKWVGEAFGMQAIDLSERRAVA
jgi:hypothetical protein